MRKWRITVELINGTAWIKETISDYEAASLVNTELTIGGNGIKRIVVERIEDAS